MGMGMMSETIAGYGRYRGGRHEHSELDRLQARLPGWSGEQTRTKVRQLVDHQVTDAGGVDGEAGKEEEEVRR